ncbi:MAG: hypothetical protein LBE91_20020 [Tannerella sp.]|jgi:hypothetical protein|nr:hypothetical protein [Tannerella sp.]
MKDFIFLLFISLCLSCGNTGDMQSTVNTDERPSHPTFSLQDDGTGEFSLSVRLKLKPQADENYLATEDPEMKALVLKHDVAFKQSFPGPKSTPELLLDYDLTRKHSMSKENFEKAINDFLDTGKFEDDVYEYGIAYTN